MIKIQFSDVDWTRDDGKIVLMSNEMFFYLEGKMVSAFAPPIITEDSFNGKTYPVQINQWESYVISTSLSEQGIHSLAKIKSCKYIVFTDTETSDSVTVDTNVNDGFIIEQLGRYSTTSIGLNITIKGNKISTYPGITEQTDVYGLRIVISGTPYFFWTEKPGIYYVSDVEKNDINDQSGLLTTAKTISKNGIKLIFYYKETEMVSLKTKLENLGYTSIEANEIPVIETPICEISELTEGLYRCEVTTVTNINTNYA